jgi:lipoprotein NlpI
MLGSYSDAINDYKMATMLMPENAKAHNSLGNIRVLFEDYREAIIDYTNAINIDNNYQMAYFNRGIARILSYNYKLGCEDLEQAIKLGCIKAAEIKTFYCENH